MDNLETKKILEENLVLNLEKNEGTKRIGNIRESLKEIRDEIEELKQCFLAPEHITQEEYDQIPRIPIDQERIDELKKDNSERRLDNFASSRVGPQKLFDVFIACDLIEFFTSNKSEEFPISCQSKTFADDINLFINLQQSESEKDIEITFTEINPSYIRLGKECFFIQGENLRELTKYILKFYREYFEALRIESEQSKIDLSIIKINEPPLSFFDMALYYVLSFFNKKEDVFNIEQDFYEENLNEEHLNCFLQNRKKIVIKKVWA